MFLAVAATFAVAGVGAETAPATTQGPAPRVATISPRRVDLRMQVRPQLPVVLIEADLTFVVNETTESVVVFLRPDMNLDLIEDADGMPLTYQRRRSFVRITTPPLDAGTEITWRFRYRARFDTSLEESGQLLLTTPWYPHLRVAPKPEEFQRYMPMAMTLTATLPQPWVLVSAGTNRVPRNDDGTLTDAWSDSVPSTEIPVAIGRFVQRDKLQQVGRLRGFFPLEQRSLIDSYIEYMGAAATFFSERIGRLNRRSWNLVALQLREDISGVTYPGITFLEVRNIDRDRTFPYRVLAHEIAHQWWNHYIQIPRARDARLREGLTT